MKKMYASPVTEPIELYLRDGVLNNVSGEAMGIDDQNDLFSSGIYSGVYGDNEFVF